MDQQDLQAHVGEAMKRWKVPGVAVGVVHDGNELVACAGVTSVENPLPVVRDTLFQPGSIGKSFTATAVMQLVDRGVVDLDVPVRAYVPDLVVEDEPTAAAVTVRHLFNHTAGWAGDRLDDTGEGDDALERYLVLMKDFAQLTPLGSAVSYNNAAVAVGGVLIERMTGMVYEDAIKKMLLEPLGLDSSFFHLNDIMTRRFAVGHVDRDGRGPTIARPWRLPRSANAAGGLSSTVPDLLRWARFHLDLDQSPASEKVLSRAARLLMQQPTVETPGGAMGDAVGISWFLRDIDGVKVVGHGGTTNGQHAQLTMVPDRHLAFVAFTNGSPGGAQLVDDLDRWFLAQFAGLEQAEPVPIEADLATLEKYVGSYETPVSLAEVSIRDGQLVLTMQMTDAGLASFVEKGERPPDPPPPAVLGLLPGTAHRYVVTEGPAQGMKGYFASDEAGHIVALQAGGRMAVRAPQPPV